MCVDRIWCSRNSNHLDWLGTGQAGLCTERDTYETSGHNSLYHIAFICFECRRQVFERQELVLLGYTMNESFAEMLAEDGKKNSLGRAGEVVDLVISNPERLEELYQTIVVDDDAWVRMRAVDAFEKICRQHAEWVEPYIDRIHQDLSTSAQASIQWHIAEIYMQIALSDAQKEFALKWLRKRIETVDVDWIVAGNSMNALVHFAKQGDIRVSDVLALLKVQLGHKSKAIAKKAQKFIDELA